MTGNLYQLQCQVTSTCTVVVLLHPLSRARYRTKKQNTDPIDRGQLLRALQMSIDGSTPAMIYFSLVFIYSMGDISGERRIQDML